MKLHADPPAALNAVTAYGPGYVEVNQVRRTHHLLLLPALAARDWPVAGFDTLKAADFDALVQSHPDVMLLGTGARQRFPARPLALALRQLKIGLEVMDTHSACRTYNILVGEGRKVAVALLIET